MLQSLPFLSARTFGSEQESTGLVRECVELVVWHMFH